LIDAQASISVPSTEKWSLDSSRFTFGWARTAARNLAAISPSSSRSRFLEKVEVIRHRIVYAEPDKPPEQQVKLQTFYQLALGPNAVERLQ